jgi:hypothetical protein
VIKLQEEPRVAEKTLRDAVIELQEVTKQINNRVFWDSPEQKVSPDVPKAGDTITQTRNDLSEITEKLRNVASRLEIIGK